ncbi:hypothetical protein KSD_53970 [Ktedonobacter sp. SOSP1-85]|nr:hypothetical protein KSD_53970 [Ktedonobacter sp. SOSP1-85]
MSAPYLTLMNEEASQRERDLREVFNGLRGTRAHGSSMAHDASRLAALGQLLILHVTPADEQNRAQVGKLTAGVQDVTGQHVEVAFVDQGYTGENTAQEAQE